MGLADRCHASAIVPSAKETQYEFSGGWMGTRAGLDGCGMSRPTEIRSPDRPACSESLYRARYPNPHILLNTVVQV